MNHLADQHKASAVAHAGNAANEEEGKWGGRGMREGASSSLLCD